MWWPRTRRCATPHRAEEEARLAIARSNAAQAQAEAAQQEVHHVAELGTAAEQAAAAKRFSDIIQAAERAHAEAVAAIEEADAAMPAPHEPNVVLSNAGYAPPDDDGDAAAAAAQAEARVEAQGAADAVREDEAANAVPDVNVDEEAARAVEWLRSKGQAQAQHAVNVEAEADNAAAWVLRNNPPLPEAPPLPQPDVVEVEAERAVERLRARQEAEQAQEGADMIAAADAAEAAYSAPNVDEELEAEHAAAQEAAAEAEAAAADDANRADAADAEAPQAKKAKKTKKEKKGVKAPPSKRKPSEKCAGRARVLPPKPRARLPPTKYAMPSLTLSSRWPHLQRRKWARCPPRARKSTTTWPRMAARRCSSCWITTA